MPGKVRRMLAAKSDFRTQKATSMSVNMPIRDVGRNRRTFTPTSNYELPMTNYEIKHFQDKMYASSRNYLFSSLHDQNYGFAQVQDPFCNCTQILLPDLR